MVENKKCYHLSSSGLRCSYIFMGIQDSLYICEMWKRLQKPAHLLIRLNLHVCTVSESQRLGTVGISTLKHKTN